MSLKAIKELVQIARQSQAHEVADAAEDEIAALEKAAKVLDRAIIQACAPVTRQQVNEAHELMATIAKEAE